MYRRYLAVAAAVLALHIAAQRSFPEELPHGMLACLFFNYLVEGEQSYSLTE